MDQQHHSTLREGLATGLIGGVVAAVWHLIIDLVRGEPFYTPNVLGQVLLGGDITPTVRTIFPQAVAGYAFLHFAVFFLLGIVLVLLAHMASRNPALRMGVWLGLVIAFLFSLGFLLVLYWATRQRFPWLPAVGGSILGVGSMGLYLWRRHPGLRGTFQKAPLGAEGKSPPHPPDRSGR
jgi:ABC-type Mn2+/Zn2+ transport system permease subunit